MYLYAALALIGAWYVALNSFHVDGVAPHLLLVGALLAVAMHVMKRASVAR